MTRLRCFLFLQGVCSPFFPLLADRIKAAGHQVLKINFNGGDWFSWGQRPAWNYRGPVEDLGDFLAEKYRRFGVTDQVLFGDCRPVHRPAVEQGRKWGIRTQVFEEGYFRPFWLTLERGGVNGYSPLPRDPAWYRETAKGLPAYAPGHPFHTAFRVRAFHDVVYHLAGKANPLFFPRYRTHAPVNAAVEYLGYARRLPGLRFHRRRDDVLLAELVRIGQPFFLLPLQLAGDAQILYHSPFKDMVDVIQTVMQSFAQHAPAEAKLIIKNHPLDMGLVRYRQIIGRLADRFGVVGRVEFMETGDLAGLLTHAKGTVTVNSTVGTTALAKNSPTLSLGNPIYNIPGLTFQGPLEQFWLDPPRPDKSLFDQFRKVVIHATQINGGFYCRKGIDLAVANCLQVLGRDRSRLEELL